MSKFLVTDPCYIIPNDEWDRIANETSLEGAGDDWVERFEAKIQGYKGENFKILLASSTANGDGGISGKTEKGDHFEIGVDAGMVCLAEVNDNFVKEGPFGALTGSFADAQNIYAAAKEI